MKCFPRHSGNLPHTALLMVLGVLLLTGCERKPEPGGTLPVLIAGMERWQPVLREASRPPAGARREVVVAATSDLHGWITNTWLFPDDRPAGLAHISGLIQSLRKETPDLLLVDGGDSLVGAPNLSVVEQMGGEAFPPILALMNQLGYLATALGNHDLENGVSTLSRWVGRSQFTWLSANLERSDGTPLLPPYRIVEREGLRIALVGMTTPGTPAWLDREILAGLRFRSFSEAARKWLPVLRQQERADLIIGLLHSGVNGDYDRMTALRHGLHLPNAAGVLADRNDGFDLIISGHAHRLSPRRAKGWESDHVVPVLEPGARGEALALARITVVSEKGRWRVSGMRREILRADLKAAPLTDPASLRLMARTRRWLSEKTAFRFRTVPVRADFHACAADLTHQAVIGLEPEAGKKTVLSLLPFLWRTHLPETTDIGQPLRRTHLRRWIPYANTPVLASLTPRQMEILLGSYLRWRAGRRTRLSLVLAPGGFEARGGKRKTELEGLFLAESGEPLEPMRRYPVWLTGYHWNGGGGAVLRALIQPEQLERKSGEDLRELIFRLLSHTEFALPPSCRVFLEPEGSRAIGNTAPNAR